MKTNTEEPTVTFQNKSVSSSAEEYEEPDYVNAAVSTDNNLPTIPEQEEHVYIKLKEPPADTYASLITDMNKKSRHPLCLVAALLAIVCVILIAATIGFISWLKVTNLTIQNQQMKAENQQMKAENQQMKAENQNLTIENKNLTTEIKNLTIENQNLTTEIKNLTIENQNLTTENDQMKAENKQLETQINNLAQQIPDEETEWIQSDVTRAPLNFNASCPIKYNILPLNHDRELELQQNQTLLLEENHNLMDDNNRLSSANQNLIQNLNNLTIRFENLTEAFDLSELRVTDLMTENQNLKTENHQLTTENQGLKTENKHLETQSNNLKQQIQDEKTEWIQSSVTRAQWSIEAYCPRENNKRQCQPCLKGWEKNKVSCYVFHNPTQAAEKKTWTEARGDCRGKGSDLAVITDEAEKTYIRNNKYGNRFWIGLRVVDGKWKWVDGSELTDSSWTEPAVEGHCAVSDRRQGWRSVRCSERNQWVCELAALSV